MKDSVENLKVKKSKINSIISNQKSKKDKLILEVKGRLERLEIEIGKFEIKENN